MDSGEIILKLLAVVFLVLLNGFFVAAEFALVKVRDTQLEALISKGHRRAKIARRIINNLDAALSSTQLGITLASLGLGWIGEPVFAQILEPLLNFMQIESEQVRHSISFAVGFSVITFLHIVAGELAPKSLAIQKPVLTSIWVAQPLEWFYRISFPAIWTLNHAAAWLLRRFGIEPVSEAELVHSEEELRLIFAARQTTTKAAFGRDVVLNALDLRRRVVRDVMRPRQQIVFLDADMSTAECMDVAEKSRYSRFPVVEEGNLDRMLGVVHVKDLYAMRDKAKTTRDLLAVTRKLIYVPETAHLEKLLHLFLEKKLHFAIVVDEYGGTVGMVTLENVLEEIVGQIQDEFDEEKSLLIKTGDNAWDIDGLLPLHELAELTGAEISGDGISTAGGWVTHQLGGFAKKGDTATVGDYELRVEEMESLRVAKLKLTRIRTAEVS